MKYFKTEVVDNFLRQENISKEEFCEMAKVTMHSLELFYNQNLDLDIESLFKIAVGINKNIVDILYKA